MWRWLAGILIGFLLALGGTEIAAAQAGIRVHEIAEDGVRVDGSLRDWRRLRMAELGDGDDASARFVLGYDRQGLYFAAAVRDDRLVRTRHPGVREDALILTVAVPQGNGYRGTEIWLYAGVAGRQAASAAAGPVGGVPRPVSGVRVVEGPLDTGSGYVLEAHIPWAVIGGSTNWQSGRAALRLRDVDSEARPVVESEPATAVVSARDLDRLPMIEATGGEADMLRTFLREESLEGTRPRYDLRGDVAGDGRAERVLVVDHFVLVTGEGFRNGTAYDYFDLPVGNGADVRSAELRDLTGDGHRELVLTLRQRNELGSRDLWQVFGITEQTIRPIFGIELRKETRQGFVQSRLRVVRARRGNPRIEVTSSGGEGLDADNFHEAPAVGVEAMLLPWGPLIGRTWQYRDGSFAVVDERPNPNPQPARPPVAARPEPEPEPEAPRGPSVQELLDAFRRSAGLPRGARPRMSRVANVAEGPQREQVMVFGGSLVVLGPGFRRGTGWFHFGLPVAAEGDVLSLETADLTGDGREELLIRIRRQAGDVTREVLLVHQFRPTGFPRLASIELMREQADHRVENRLRVVGRGRARALEVTPSSARGWNATSWPFAEGAGDGIDPVLLPWRDRAVRYRYEGGRLTR